MNRILLKRTAAGLCLAGAIVACWSSSNAASPQMDKTEKTAAEQFKNIQVLKDMPASKLRGTMEYMSASLGVECNFCHENPFDSDQKEAKKAAREMLRMVEEINKSHFGGEMEVSCWTCHHGSVHPSSAVSLDASHSMFKPASDGLPTADEVLDKYVQALGGKAAVEKVQTRMARANEVSSEGHKATVESYAKAPDRLWSTTTQAAPARTVFTVGIGGASPWRHVEREGRPPMAGPLRDMELAQVARMAEFFPALRLRESYKNLAVVGTDKIPVLERGTASKIDHDVYVLVGRAPDGVRERFYFDMKTGLLVRRAARFATYLGGLPIEVDYGDYRPVAGVKEPFTTRWSTSDGGWTDTFTVIRHNVPVDDAKFEMPADAR